MSELQYVDVEGGVPAKEVRHATDGLDPATAELYEHAVLASGQNALGLRTMALLAFEHRDNKEHMKLLSLLWGRNSRHLATAVVRWPEWFMGKDAQAPIDAEPDELLALFVCAQLPKAESAALYDRMRRTGMRSYEVRAYVDAKMESVRASAGLKVRLRVKGAKVMDTTEEGKRFGMQLAWSEKPVAEASLWNNQTVDFSLTLNPIAQAAKPETPEPVKADPDTGEVLE